MFEYEADIVNFKDIDTVEIENQLLENFGDRYLVDAIRIVSTKDITPYDGAVVIEALNLVVSMYVRKMKAGEINLDRILH